MNDFEEYIRQGVQTVHQHIEGDITIEETKQLIDSYYQSKTVRADIKDRTEKADKVSARIAEISSENTFTFSPVEYITIHHRLFQGIYKFAERKNGKRDGFGGG